MKGNRYTQSEIDFIKSNYIDLLDREIAVILNRSTYSVREKRKQLKLFIPEQFKNVRMLKQGAWSVDEEKYLTENYIKYTVEQLMKLMNRGHSSIKNKILKLNLTLPEAVREERKARSKFKPGHISWNKGVKGYMQSNKTSFKPGHVPANKREVGYVAVRLDKRTGYPTLRIKIAEPNKWESLSVYNYKKTYGDYPKGYMVTFKDGNSLNCNIENLHLMSLKERLLKNKPEDFYNVKNYLTDKYVLGVLTRGFTKQQRKIMKQNFPELIQLKKQELLLRKAI